MDNNEYVKRPPEDVAVARRCRRTNASLRSREKKNMLKTHIEKTHAWIINMSLKIQIEKIQNIHSRYWPREIFCTIAPRSVWTRRAHE